jgi:ATP synthase F1 complex assembly factor 2
VSAADSRFLLTCQGDGGCHAAQGLDRWHLAAAEQLAASCKSVLLGLAATAQALDIGQVLAAARLEEDHQMEQWGLVEGGHDIDIADMRVRVAAPCLFVRLLQHH